MKNCELIERLKKLDPLADVYFCINEDVGYQMFEINEVKGCHRFHNISDIIDKIELRHVIVK